ncbi:MAG: hypothetical protein FWD58_04530 [Firmicutes bacterium]|nr:hypothetical protein [Bacillota bacterium]
MINVAGILCSVAAALTPGAVADLPAASDAAIGAAPAVYESRVEPGSAAPDSTRGTLPDRNKRDGAGVKPQATPARANVTAAEGARGTTDFHSGRGAHEHAASAAQNNQMAGAQGALNNQSANITDADRNLNDNRTGTRGDLQSVGRNRQSGNFAGTQNRGAARNNRTNRNAFDNQGTLDRQSAIGNLDGQDRTDNRGAFDRQSRGRETLSRGDLSRTGRFDRGQMNRGERFTRGGTSRADTRYNAQKARLDEQYAPMFELKAELDSMKSQQSSKWEEYYALHQSYEKQLVRLVSDWVDGQGADTTDNVKAHETSFDNNTAMHNASGNATVGNNAMHNAVGNTAVGNNAMHNAVGNTAVGNNTAIGNTAVGNTTAGNNAMHNTAGNALGNNTAVGNTAMHNASLNNNTATHNVPNLSDAAHAK